MSPHDDGMTSQQETLTHPDGSPVRVLVVGQSLAEVHATTRNLLLIFVATALLGVGAGSVGVAYLVRRTLEPVGELQRLAASISDMPLAGGDVSFPERPTINVAHAGTEVAGLASSFNSMLTHVEDALTQREETEAKLKQFAADASHELRTPLASISGYAQLAARRNDALPEEVATSLERIKSESGRMSKIVEDLLLLARLDSAQETDGECTLLAPVVLESLADARVAGPDHDWHVHISQTAAQLQAPIGELALRQALGNLLTNARVHTPSGTRVSVTLESSAAGMVAVHVEDNGPGIPAELAPKVFDRFVRADTGRTGLKTSGDDRRSTGLGLSITDQLIRSSGGSVTVASVPGRTVFSIWLPQL